MINELSPIAWIALGGLLIFIVLLNVSLITALKSRNDDSPSILQKAADGIRSPWKNENEQLAELSKRVEKLKEISADKHKDQE